MVISIRNFLLAAVLAATAPFASADNRPITLVASAGVGGLIDIVSRAYAVALSEELGQPVVVQNRGGAGGVLAANALATSRPDGLTICFCFNGPVALAKAGSEPLPYDIDKAFQPVARVYSISPIISVHASSPFKSLADIVSAAKAAPGKLSYGHTGNVGASNIGIQEIAQRGGLQVTGIQYPSEAKMMPDLLAGRLDFGVLSPMLAKTQAADNRIRIIASMGVGAALDDVPVVGEMPEFKGFVAPSWAGFFVPAGTPQAIVRKLYDGIQRASQREDVRKQLTAFSVQPVTGETPEEFARLIEVDKERVMETMKRVGNI